MSATNLNKPTWLRAGKYNIKLNRPLIMGILNVTPDSFHDGGKYFDSKKAIARATELVNQGADIIDLGGESSRPGALPVDLDDELDRVIPVLREISKLDVPISIDTNKPEVMRETLNAGASIINDIYGFRKRGALEVVSTFGAGICIMHMQKTPSDMQVKPQYENLVEEIKEFLMERVAAAKDSGISDGRIIIDPGFGFGKSFDDNMKLFCNLNEFNDLGLATLVGVSRKSFLGEIANQNNERLYISVMAGLMAAQKGINILRVHDVNATKDPINFLLKVSEYEK